MKSAGARGVAEAAQREAARTEWESGLDEASV